MDHTPICIGTRTYWVSPEEKLVLLAPEDRAQHLYVVGKTGLGKSTLLRNLILQDLYAGRGVGLLDPHGDLAREVLDAIPTARTGEVLYFNPGDLARPVGLNLLPKVPRDAEHLVVSGVLSAFRGIWGGSWGPRLEYILGHALAALLDHGGLTILALPRLLADDAFRERLTAKIRDPIVRGFWRHEYAGYERRFRLDAIAPIQNKIGRLLANAPMRNILGQTTSRFDARFLMDRGRIMIADLAKGVIGDDQARLLGALLLSQFQWAAMQRANAEAVSRTPFYLYIDEFHSFATDALTSILAEARKYGLALVLVHQYLDQLTEEIRQSVFGNAGNLIAFRVGQSDARILEGEFGGNVKMGNLVSLGKYEIYARLLDRGRMREPFRGRTLAPVRGTATGRREAVIRRSRERYGRPREEVEAKIERWLHGLSAPPLRGARQPLP
ncbi:MAG TPA: TraM recognition domain-containing protein [Thermoanaerobaculia bacterium]|nr:TraM recognition domain-containing protein [Thermoanaerobaculia bacterium]